MSGCGRKHRAKHLTQQYLDVTAWQGLNEGEVFAVCVDSPQSQHVRVLLLFPPDDSLATLSQARTAGALPTHSSDGCTSSSCVGSAKVDDSKICVKDTCDSVLPEPGIVESLVRLPGKFRKVIWLRVKDVVVVAKDTIVLKPSPEQLAKFYKDSANVEWANRIKVAQCIAEKQRSVMERLPVHIRLTTTTTSQLPGQKSAQILAKTEANMNLPRDVTSSPPLGGHADAESSCGRAMTSVTTQSTADGKRKPYDGGNRYDLDTVQDALNDCSDGSDTSLDGIVNPNRQNIRHRMQFFHGIEEHDDEEDELEDDGME